MTTTFTIEKASPADASNLVRDTAALSGTIHSSSPLYAVEVRLNGDLVFASKGQDKFEWAYPNYHGRATMADQRLTYVIEHRRRFDPDTLYVLTFLFQYGENDGFGSTTVTLKFTTESRESPLSVDARTAGVLDRTLSHVALNSLRAYLLGALSTRANAPPAEVLFRHRVSRSSLASMLPEAQRDTKLIAEDIASVVAVAVIVDGLVPFWEAALQEARRLGVPDATLTLYERTMAAPYPQERVAAAAALLLTVAKYL